MFFQRCNIYIYIYRPITKNEHISFEKQFCLYSEKSYAQL